MTKFDPKFIVPVSASKEFKEEKKQRSAQDILLDSIGKQLELYKDPKAEGRRWMTVGKTEVSIQLRVGNKPLKLMGEDTRVVVPIDQFEGAMAYFADRVRAGEFDPQLTIISASMAERSAKISQARKAKK